MEFRNIILPTSEIPQKWYNIAADLPSPMNPPLNPATGKPLAPEDLAPIFPMNIIEQEVSQQRFIDIPEEVLEKYLIWRPTPLCRARGLENALKTPAKIYYKNEGVSPPGSHKPNTAIAQAYYNKIFGTKKIYTETGAGQWGSALAFACSLFGLECEVFMVKISYNQKPYRRMMMEVWGATCFASPSNLTKAGRTILEKDPDSPGSLGVAISEAVEKAVTSETSRYALGSVLNHVMLHQTIIGLEAKKQLAAAGDYPDVIIGCAGGGSNFAGTCLPFIREKIAGKEIKLLAVEPTSCPTLTKGPFTYDFGDTAGLTPLLPMYTLGHNFTPEPIHAGGLRYHGMAPIVSKLISDQLVTPLAIEQMETFAAGITWARTEGFISAPEANHAIAAVIREANQAREEGKEKVILFTWSGHGLLDMAAYDAYLSKKLSDHAMPEELLNQSLAQLKGLPTI